MLKRLRNLAATPGVLARGTSGVSPLLRNDPPAVEQRTALLSGKRITYTLKRSGKRRSIGLRIDDRGLTISVPLRASEKWLHSVLQDKASWVVEKLDGWQSRKPLEILWQDGEKIDYLGEQLVLRVVQSLFASTLERRGSELWVFVDAANETAYIEKIVSRWYQREALHFFEQRVALYAQLLNVAPCAIKLTAAKAQWGSCTVSGTVRLNVQLIKLPLRLIDYVVVHELAHLREMNHSAAFWRVVASACPDYASLRGELKDIAL
jgi:predicted metal-dependent hydrolase